MTLAAIWIEERSHGPSPLCFASDSRTTPGPIEGVTKVVLFGREDLAGVWAGDYRFATLLVAQLDALFTASDAMRRRDIDVEKTFLGAIQPVKTLLARAMNPRVHPGSRVAEAQVPLRTTLVLGGYSMRRSTFVLMSIGYSPAERRWRLSVKPAEPTRIYFIGDERKRARQVASAARSRRQPQPAGGWRMEPLAAIHEACLKASLETIGGDLQLVKTYTHGSARAYGFVDPRSPSLATARGAQVNARSARELAGAGLLIDLSKWLLDHGSYAAKRAWP